mgnify:CR=1 FL=1
MRLADVEKFVQSQTPTQLFKKHPLYQGKTVASRAGERIFADIIDYTNQPSGSFKYVMLAIDVCSRHVWAKAMTAETGASITQTFKSLAADIGPMKEVDGDAEFEQTKALQTFLGSNNIAFMGQTGGQRSRTAGFKYGESQAGTC